MTAILFDRLHKFHANNPVELARQLEKFESNVAQSIRRVGLSLTSASLSLSGGLPIRYDTQADMVAAEVDDMQIGFVDVGSGSVWIFVALSARDASDTVLDGVGGQWINIAGVSAPVPTIQRHELISNTVGLWQLEDDLLDTSGNSFTLSAQAGAVGAPTFGELWPGFVGYANIGGANQGLFRNSADATLRLTGDMTIQFLAAFDEWPAADEFLVAHGSENADATASNNYLYALHTSGNAQALGLGWHQESSTGTDANFAPGNVGSSAASPIPALYRYRPIAVAVTRASGVVQMYLNGKAWGPPSSALTTPTSGTSGRLYVLTDSAGGATDMHMKIASLRILSVARSAGDILADYNATMGLVFGERE